jgi:mRNA-degrading endonuclease RelE of RelBE toxin-antitoxin system
VREIEWTEALDKGIARRMKRAVERLAETGAGNVKNLQGITPPEYRLRVGDRRSASKADDESIRVLRVRNRKEAYR